MSHYLPGGSVFFLETPIFLLILSADFELGTDCLPSDGLPLPGGGVKGRLVPLGFDLVLESVSGEHAQLFTEGFPIIFHEGPFSSWNCLFSC